MPLVDVSSHTKQIFLNKYLGPKLILSVVMSLHCSDAPCQMEAIRFISYSMKVDMIFHPLRYVKWF